jgi:hypothetical protein
MISDYYDKTFTVEGPTTTQSNTGAWTPGWSSLGTIKGWIDYLSGQDVNVGAQFIDRATHVIGCSSTCSWVLNSYRIKDSDNLIYRVLHNDDPVRIQHHREIILEFNQSDNLST